MKVYLCNIIGLADTLFSNEYSVLCALILTSIICYILTLKSDLIKFISKLSLYILLFVICLLLSRIIIFGINFLADKYEEYPDKDQVSEILVNKISVSKDPVSKVSVSKCSSNEVNSNENIVNKNTQIPKGSCIAKDGILVQCNCELPEYPHSKGIKFISHDTVKFIKDKDLGMDFMMIKLRDSKYKYLIPRLDLTGNKWDFNTLIYYYFYFECENTGVIKWVGYAYYTDYNVINLDPSIYKYFINRKRQVVIYEISERDLIK